MNVLYDSKVLESIRDSLLRYQVVLLKAPTGSGKTTILPDYLNQKDGSAVLVLEPRRVAVLSAAQFIATKRQEALGHSVGYQVRLDSKKSPQTQILFITEALLLKFLIQDPELKKFRYVILDEFHERSQYTDISLGVLKKILSVRKDLSILIMSATVGDKELKALFPNLVTWDIPSLGHPLEILHETKPQLLRIDKTWLMRMESLICQAMKENPGQSILVFLPGRGECESLAQKLKQNPLVSLSVRTLHGQKSLSQQKEILSQSDKPRIILSTNVAESSVTVPGVTVVVDSGLERISTWVPEGKWSELQLKRITLASHRQRAGRASRLGPGKAYLAWYKADELSMKADIEPEISRCDLRSLLLLLSLMGYPKGDDFPWLSPPDLRFLQNAIKDLQDKKLLDLEGDLSPQGKQVALLPFEFDWAYSLSLLCQDCLTDKSSLTNKSSLVSTVSLERDQDFSALKLLPVFIFLADYQNFQSFQSYQTSQSSHSFHSSDSSHNFQNYENYQSLEGEEGDFLKELERVYDHKFFRERIEKPLKEVGSLCGLKGSEEFFLKDSGTFFSSAQFRRIFLRYYLQAFPERLAQQRPRHPRKCLMAQGKGAVLSFSLKAKPSQYFVVLDLQLVGGDFQVRRFMNVTLEDILSLPESFFSITQCEDSGDSLYVIERVFFGSLVLKESRFLKEKKDLIFSDKNLFKQEIRNRFLSSQEKFLSEALDFSQVLQRWFFWCDHKGVEDLMPELPQFLLEEALDQGVSSWQEFVSIKDWTPYFAPLLSYVTFQSWIQDCPESFVLPSKKVLPLKYKARILGEESSVEGRVILSALFALKSHPCILNKPVRLIILGPHQRPVQITQDILFFWKNSYPEIRKELRGRYSKHPWPENPLLLPLTVKL
jgi:ATP-dependent helicase HrpB